MAIKNARNSDIVNSLFHISVKTASFYKKFRIFVAYNPLILLFMNALINRLIESSSLVSNMTRISKRHLTQDTLLKLYRLFFEVLSRYQTRNEFFDIFDDILSPTEKIMLTKRVAIIYLLTKGLDYRDICEALKVSMSTVVSYAAVFYKRDSKVVAIIRNMLKKEKVLNFLDDIFSGLLIQPGVKLGHWEQYWQHKKRQQERKVLP